MSLRVLLARAARDKAVHSDGLAVAKRFPLMGHCAHHRSHVEELLCNHRAILVPVNLLPHDAFGPQHISPEGLDFVSDVVNAGVHLLVVGVYIIP